MVRIVTDHDKTLLDTRKAKEATKRGAKKAGVWVHHEIRHDIKEFTRFWVLELLLLVLLNFHTAHVVEKIAHTAKVVMPWW